MLFKFLCDFETKSCCVTQAGLGHMILLPQPLKHWCYIINVPSLFFNCSVLFLLRRSLSYLLIDWIFNISLLSYFLTCLPLYTGLFTLLFHHSFHFYSLEIIVHFKAIISEDWEMNYLALPDALLCGWHKFSRHLHSSCKSQGEGGIYEEVYAL